jgi:hypothetical protein
MELGVSFGLEILKDFIKEGFRVAIEKLVEKQVLERKTIGSIIYFTMFNPRISTINLDEFLEGLVKSVGQKLPTREPFQRVHLLLIGRTQFIIDAYVTKLSDILFYDRMHRELVDALEGGEERYEIDMSESEDLARELGLEDPQILEKISDITIIMSPRGKPRAEDVHELIRVIYDKGAQDFSVDRAVVKITIYAPSGSKDLDDIDKKLRGLRIRTYRLPFNDIEKLIVVLNTPSQILGDKVYRAVYGGFSISFLH